MSLENLTIVIPTFNRVNLLRRSLCSLLPILPTSVRLLIIDNCSADIVSKEVADIVADYPIAKVDIYRNNVNIGGNANIMRAIEYCDTRYVWILGDDDIVCPEAFENISEAFMQYPGSAYYNFSTEGGWRRESVKITKGLHDFIKNGVDDLGQIMFISSSIFDAHKLKPHCAAGMHYGYSMLPHIVTLFSALRESKKSKCVLLPKTIVAVNHAENDASQMGSCHTSALGMPVLLTLPWGHNEYVKLTELIAAQAQSWLAPRAVFLSLLFAAQDEKKRKHVLVVFRIIRKNLYSLRFNLSLQLRASFYGMLLKCPQLSLKAVDSVYKIFGKKPPRSNFEMI